MAAALPSLPECCDECTTCNTTVTVIDNASGELAGWFKVKSLAEGKAIPTASTNKVLEINGNETGGDGFLGTFTFDSLSALGGDDANVLLPDDNPALGRWIRKV